MGRGLAHLQEEVVLAELVEAVEDVDEVGLPHLGAPLEHHALEDLDGEAVPPEALGGRVADRLDPAEADELGPEAHAALVGDGVTPAGAAAGLGEEAAVGDREVGRLGMGRRRQGEREEQEDGEEAGAQSSTSRRI